MPKTEIDLRHCSRCNSNKPRSSFQTRIVSGRRYPRTRCSVCENQMREERRSPEARSRLDKRHLERRKVARKLPKNRAKCLLDDSRKSDVKFGRLNNLDLGFIEAMVAKVCSYCRLGSPIVRMTLDRIDNDLGHIKENVVASCLRCNWARNNKPYGEWVAFVKSMHIRSFRKHVHTLSRSWHWRHRNNSGAWDRGNPPR